MTAEQREDLLKRVSLVFLGASNVVADGETSLDGDEELESLNSVLLAAHFYMQERIRTLREPITALTVHQAEKLSNAREKLATKLSRAADIFVFNAREHLEATKEFAASSVQARETTFRQLQLPSPHV